MTDHPVPTLEDVDRDGALSEAIADLCGSTRADVPAQARRSAAPRCSPRSRRRESAAAQISDVGILNFGLRFERLQATFYTQADEMGTIGPMTPPQAAVGADARRPRARARAHHQEGARAQGEGRPTFDFGKANETDAGFTRTAVAMEDLTVALLTGVDAARARPPAHRGAVRPADRRGAPRRVGAPHRRHRRPRRRAFDEPRTLDSVQRHDRRARISSRRPQVTSAAAARATRGEAAPAAQAVVGARRCDGGDPRRRASARPRDDAAGRLARGRRCRRRSRPRSRPGAPRRARLDALPRALGTGPARRPSRGGRPPRRPGGRGGADHDARGHRATLVAGARPAQDAAARVGARPARRAAQRHHGLGPADARSAATQTVDTRSTSTSTRLTRDAAAATAAPVLRAPIGRRAARGADAARALLRPQPAHALSQPDLRPDRVRDERALADADRLAGGRLRRHPRHRPARSSSPAASRTAASGCATPTSSRLARRMPVGTPVHVH